MSKELELQQTILALLSRNGQKATPAQIESLAAKLNAINVPTSQSIKAALRSFPPFNVVNESVNSTDADYWITVIGNILAKKQ